MDYWASDGGGVGFTPLPLMQSNMEATVHLLEQEAYTSVLRAFKSQSDAITWEKESLIRDLRKELRVSHEEHRQLISRVNSDDVIRKIREWRKVNVLQPGIPNAHPSHNLLASPMPSAPRKKQKTSHSVASMSFGEPSPTFHPLTRLSSSPLQQSSFSGSRGRKLQTYPSAGFTESSQIASRSSSGAFVVHEAVRAEGFDSLIGRKVWTRWPEDNNFYEAVITKYDPVEVRHALVYDINTATETWEWVNLMEVSPEDIVWDDDAPRISHRGGHGGPGWSFKKAMAHGGAVLGPGRGRKLTKSQTMDLRLSENGPGKKPSSDIEILHTDSLIKDVERVISSYHPSPAELERAKKVLEEHEEALVEAIISLKDASDGESGGRKLKSIKGNQQTWTLAG